MASRTCAADDFATIKKEMGRIEGIKSAPVVSSSSSPAKPQGGRAADDFAEIAKYKRDLKVTGDVAYPKDKPASLGAAPVWPGPTNYTRMGGSPVAKL